jgi:putative addiction module antidote
MLLFEMQLPRETGPCTQEDIGYNPRMNAPLKITKIGNSAGIVLPKELLARLRVGVGDTLYVTEAPDGIRITASDPEFAEKMAVAEQVMREDRDILRILAQ